MEKRIQIMDAQAGLMKLNRLAYEIVENNIDSRELVLAGIVDRGVALSYLLKHKIEKISKIKVEIAPINIDKHDPVNCSMDAGFDPEGKNIIIVDDVANSGRTLMYALKPFLNSLPAKVQVAVLVDRKHKLFPVTPDYVGLQLSTTLQDNILVEIKEHEIVGAFME